MTLFMRLFCIFRFPFLIEFSILSIKKVVSVNRQVPSQTLKLAHLVRGYPTAVADAPSIPRPPHFNTCGVDALKNI
jgi:hypothetical protein